MRAKINSLLVFFLLHFDIDMKYSYMENNFNGKLKKLSKETCNAMPWDMLKKKQLILYLLVDKQYLYNIKFEL